MLTRSIPAAIAAALLLAVAAPGCGESESKRSVDARAEVLQFYAVDAPVVAILRTEPLAAVAELDRAAEGVPVWVEMRETAGAWLAGAGLGEPELRMLVRAEEPIAEFDAAALALGAATPADLAEGRALLVLATDQAELLDRIFMRNAGSGTLRRLGEVDEADLYRSDVASYAVRDGVLVSARHLADVRTAIERRDGDSDLQLDESVVQSLFAELGTHGPLLVYASLDAVREADLGLRTLGQLAPWTAQLDLTAATARVEGGELAIEDLSKAKEAFQAGEVPVGAEPAPFEINAPVTASLIPLDGPVRRLLSGLGRVEGDATATSEEVHLQLRPAP